jgi:uncharacterized membrane protein
VVAHDGVCLVCLKFLPAQPFPPKNIAATVTRMREIFGLPAHPLFVHAPLVLVPLLAVCAIALAAKQAWRHRLGTWFLGASAGVFVLVFLAVQSGEEFDKGLAGQVDVKRHEELAETTRLLTFLFVVGAIAMVVVDRRSRGRADGNQQMFGRVAAGATALLGILATVWMVRTGHEGAKVVWETTTLVKD